MKVTLISATSDSKSHNSHGEHTYVHKYSHNVSVFVCVRERVRVSVKLILNLKSKMSKLLSTFLPFETAKTRVIVIK